MPYALFENEFRLSRTFPTATDVWRCAEDCGLVIDEANGRRRLDDGLRDQALPARRPGRRGTGVGLDAEIIQPEPERDRALRGYLIKCSNLQRGDSMKDPVSIFGCWRGFQLEACAQA